MIEDLAHRRTGGGERVTEWHGHVGWQIDGKREAIVSALRNVVFEEVCVEEGEIDERTADRQAADVVFYPRLVGEMWRPFRAACPGFHVLKTAEDNLFDACRYRRIGHFP